MVLESLLNPLQAETHPAQAGILGFLYASLALFLSLWIFEEQAGMVMVFLTALAALPLMFHTLRFEEHKDSIIDDERALLREHSKALRFFMYLFGGMAFAFTLWYVALPSDISSSVFKTQVDTIANLNPQVTGALAQAQILSKIFLNNIKVMIFCLLFSFIYGSGAIFILAWNASVIGAAAGNFVRVHLAQFADASGLSAFGAYFYVSGLSLLRYAIHGIPEILAYFVAGLAGGILSVALMRKEYRTQNFEKILLDFSDLVLLAVGILFVAAILEVFVTPLFFR